MKLWPALAILLAGVCQAAPATYYLDPENSFVHFELQHFGTSTLRGRFGPIRGEVTLDREAGRGEVGLRINTANVDTGVRVLDSRLREPDLLDSVASPEAFFVARQFRFEGGQLVEVRGEFTLRGSSQPLSLRALRFSCREEAAVQTCGGNFEAFVKRSDFGMSFGLPLVADSVRLLVQVEGRRR